MPMMIKPGMELLSETLGDGRVVVKHEDYQVGSSISAFFAP